MNSKRSRVLSIRNNKTIDPKRDDSRSYYSNFEGNSEDADKVRANITPGGDSGYGLALPKIDIKKIAEIRSKSTLRGGDSSGL